MMKASDLIPMLAESKTSFLTLLDEMVFRMRDVVRDISAQERDEIISLNAMTLCHEGIRGVLPELLRDQGYEPDDDIATEAMLAAMAYMYSLAMFQLVALDPPEVPPL